LDVASSVFYQIAYISAATWGAFAVLLLVTVARWRIVETATRVLLVFLLLLCAEWVLLSAVHMAAYDIAWHPNGRYFSAFFPIFIIVALKFLSESPIARQERRGLFAACCGLALIMAFATPLRAFAPGALVNCPELAFLFTVIDKGHIEWRAVYDPSLMQRVVFALGALVASLLFIFGTASSRYRALALSLVVVASVAITISDI
jgi:hypothetical protein